MLGDRTLFIFLDESGNFDFSPKASRYWSLTALCTFNSIPGRDDLQSLLYELASAGFGQEYFHATEDKQAVRDEVFRLINALPDDFEVHAVLAEKCKTNPVLYKEYCMKGGRRIEKINPAPLYDRVCRTLLKYIFTRAKFKQAKRIVVILSAIFEGPRHAAIEKTLRIYLSNHCESAPFVIYFHSTKADFNCQIADYCGWAIGKRWERNDNRSYDLIRHHIKSEFPIFSVGETKYY